MLCNFFSMLISHSRGLAFFFKIILIHFDGSSFFRHFRFFLDSALPLCENFSFKIFFATLFLCDVLLMELNVQVFPVFFLISSNSRKKVSSDIGYVKHCEIQDSCEYRRSGAKKSQTFVLVDSL